MPIIDQVFEMGGGYVLDFSNASFYTFFITEIGINIDDVRYCVDGGSKAKRLRCFLLSTDRTLAVKTLTALWEYRSNQKLIEGSDSLSPRVKKAFFDLIKRLDGSPPQTTSEQSPSPHSEVGKDVYIKLVSDFESLLPLDPHPRGYAFERFLNELFEVFKLAPRASFKLRGEQIDGSFDHAGQTYLLEAKWTNKQTDAAALRGFNSKVEDKAKWSRGLFVSYSGFTTDGLFAFGKGKSIICVDGLDLHEALSKQVHFARVVEAKARLVAETGNPFIQVRDIQF